MAVARQQVNNGANLIDINMDEGLIDSGSHDDALPQPGGVEPEIARVPFMVDSSRWSVLEAGLRCIQGKPVVNSISLKDGEAEFLRRARLIQRYGAAVIVMAFDEAGQADSFARKVAVCQRAYRLLVEEVGFDPADIIFDPNVLTVATGIEAHADYGLAFIEALRTIKATLPQARTIGGISNVSFSFRGNNMVREAMHAAFLYHAIQAGLDLGIVNAGMITIYEEIEPALREGVEDVLFNRRPDATERLVEIAEGFRDRERVVERQTAEWRLEPVEARLQHALVKGIVDFIDADVEEALREVRPAAGRHRRPLDGRHEHRRRPLRRREDVPAASGQERQGDEEGGGLPDPPPGSGEGGRRGQLGQGSNPHGDGQGRRARYRQEHRRRGPRLQQLRGDRSRGHGPGRDDPGRGTGAEGGHHRPVRPDHAFARRDGACGARAPAHRPTVPLLIGGATTSPTHTAVKIDPEYGSPTVHVPDASRAVGVVRRLLDPAGRAALAAETEADYAHRRARHAARGDRQPLLPLDEARANRPAIDWSAAPREVPAFTGSRVLDGVDLAEIATYIDWTPFFHAWELRGAYPRILDEPGIGARAQELFDDARQLLDRIIARAWLEARGVYGFFPANSQGDDILVFDDAGRGETRAVLHSLRQQNRRAPGQPNFALADWIAPLAPGASGATAAALAAGRWITSVPSR